MIYEELGYDKFFNKPKATAEISDADFDLAVEGISANKITEGISQSNTLKVDYNEGTIERKEGATTRLSIGKFNDGKYGMRVYSAAGTQVIDQSA